MNDSYKIRRFGRTLVVTLPTEILKEARLKEGDKVAFGITPANHVLLRRANQDVKAARKRRYCPNCGVEITSTDFEGSKCTNCGVGL